MRFLTRMATLAAATASLTLAAAAIPAQAAGYPERPVQVIVPFAPGGGADVMARLLFSKASEKLGQTFVIENKPGAGGLLGSDIVAKAKPDGYTLLLGQTGPNAINPALFKDLPYDPIKDFEPVIQLTSYPYVLVAHPKEPFNTFAELVKQSQDEPGRFTFGTAGLGSSAQLTGEMLMRTANFEMVHVPFKGAGPAALAAVGGVVSLTFGDMASSTPLVRDGRLKAIAITGPKRVPLLPEVPTVDESGYPGFDANAWHAVYAPAGTPREVVLALNAALAEVLKSPEVVERLRGDGIEPVGESPEAFGEFTRNEVKKWGDIVKAAGIELQR